MAKTQKSYMTVYIPKRAEGLLEWLRAEAKRQERSVNAVIVRLLIAAKENSSEKEA